MSEPGLGEILDAIKGLQTDAAEMRAELAALREDFSKYSPLKPVTGDELVWSWGRRPKFWNDLPVRIAAIELHRKATLDSAVSQLVEQFGPARAPSKSGLGRLWLLIDRQPRRRA